MSSDDVRPQDEPVKDHHGTSPQRAEGEAETSPETAAPPSAASAPETAAAVPMEQGGSADTQALHPPTLRPAAELEAAAEQAIQQVMAEPARPRVRLNPTSDPTARAVPNVEPSSNPPVPPAMAGGPITPSAHTAEGAPPTAEKPPTPPAPPRGPVEIPRSADLDPNLEAEISAALDMEQHRALAAATTPAALAEPTTAAAAPAAQVPPRPATEEELEPGMRLPAKVQSISGEDVFLDLGFRSPGVLSLRQFDEGKQPTVGLMFEVTVERYAPDEGLIHCNLPRGRRRVGGNWDAVTPGQIVDCMVNKTNKGGLEVTVGGLRGFLPASQIELGFVSDMEQYVGQKLTVQVAEVNPQKRNLVVSRKAYLQAQRQEAEKDLWEKLEVGQTYRGTVKTVKDYGAFIDIGGVDGFLHVGEISWQRVRHPSDLLKDGQQVYVQVIKLDPEKRKISLGMKQLRPDPWSGVGDKYPPGSTVTGTVTRTTEFGAFVEIEEGLEGLIHISELAHQRTRRVTDVVNVGQQVSAKVLEVDPNRKRVSLSLKALQERPEEPRPAEEPAAPQYERKHRGPLKGGTSGTSSGGGLFGDPRHFGS